MGLPVWLLEERTTEAEEKLNIKMYTEMEVDAAVALRKRARTGAFWSHIHVFLLTASYGKSHKLIKWLRSVLRSHELDVLQYLFRLADSRLTELPSGWMARDTLGCQGWAAHSPSLVSWHDVHGKCYQAAISLEEIAFGRHALQVRGMQLQAVWKSSGALLDMRQLHASTHFIAFRS